MTGYGKYLPEGSSSEFRIAVNDLPIDEFHDCASSGSADVQNTAADLSKIVPDEDGFAWYEAFSQDMTLFGEASILGKSLVVYADEYDNNQATEQTRESTTTDNRNEDESGSLVETKNRLLTSQQDYQNRIGKPIACCTIRQTSYFA